MQLIHDDIPVARGMMREFAAPAFALENLRVDFPDRDVGMSLEQHVGSASLGFDSRIAKPYSLSAPRFQ
jgi:hypothetical protein